MQSGNGMTMQEAEQEIKYYQKIFQVARLLKGEDVERTFYQQGKGTCENVQDGCPCYSFWKKNGKCENCSSYKALREKKQMIKLEFLESEVYQVISRYMEIDGQPYVMELINHLEDDTLIDISCREKLINKLTGYNEKLFDKQQTFTITYKDKVIDKTFTATGTCTFHMRSMRIRCYYYRDESLTDLAGSYSYAGNYDYYSDERVSLNAFRKDDLQDKDTMYNSKKYVLKSVEMEEADPSGNYAKKTTPYLVKERFFYGIRMTKIYVLSN